MRGAGIQRGADRRPGETPASEPMLVGAFAVAQRALPAAGEQARDGLQLWAD
jgi:hypothetical protein